MYTERKPFVHTCAAHYLPVRRFYRLLSANHVSAWLAAGPSVCRLAVYITCVLISRTNKRISVARSSIKPEENKQWPPIILIDRVHCQHLLWRNVA